jgi:alpha-L-fucosidase
MLETLPTPGDTSWFVKDRFGMFIHWGLYSLAARHEWIQMIEKMGPEVYRKYFERFDPDLYNPEVWADAAANAGMKYFVITTKHHEGFALWDSKHTDFKATNTPYGKDVLRPMVKAFNERGLRTGFYHSLIDWHHPDFWVDKNHPLRDLLPGKIGPDGQPITSDINHGRDQMRYTAYLRDQVRELLTEFGPVDILWFDFSYPDLNDRTNFAKGKGREAWESEKLYALVRELMPKIILTDRLDMPIPLSGGDMVTPEQGQPRQWVTIEHEGKQVPVVWEACQTFSGSWGYHRDEQDWRSVRQLITTLIDCVSKGGNLLLNVGPTGRGEIDHRAMDRLKGIGKWMHHHSRSIYNCTQAPPEFTCPRDCRLTWNPDTRRLYVHLLNWPYQHFALDGEAYADRVAYVQLLHNASEVHWQVVRPGKEVSQYTMGITHARAKDQTSVMLRLPKREPDGIEIPVLEVFMKD